MLISTSIAQKQLIHSHDLQSMRNMRYQQILQHQQDQQNIAQQQIKDAKIKELEEVNKQQLMVIDHQKDIIETQHDIQE